MGYWAIAASAVQLLIWYGLPKLFGHFTNDYAQIAAAALRAGGTGLLTVFGLLAGVGVTALVGRVCAANGKRRPALIAPAASPDTAIARLPPSSCWVKPTPIPTRTSTTNRRPTG